MRLIAFVATLLLLGTSVLVATPAAQAYPCQSSSPGECINRVLAAAGCWDAGGDPFADPFHWTPGVIALCVLDNMD